MDHLKAAGITTVTPANFLEEDHNPTKNKERGTKKCSALYANDDSTDLVDVATKIELGLRSNGTMFKFSSDFDDSQAELSNDNDHDRGQGTYTWSGRDFFQVEETFPPGERDTFFVYDLDKFAELLTKKVQDEERISGRFFGLTGNGKLMRFVLFKFDNMPALYGFGCLYKAPRSKLYIKCAPCNYKHIGKSLGTRGLVHISSTVNGYLLSHEQIEDLNLDPKGFFY